MTFLTSKMTQSAGPTVLLPRRSTTVGLVAPSWQLLSCADGRKRLIDTLCRALLRDGHAVSWHGLNQPAEQADAQFLARLLAQVAILLQNLAGHPVTRSSITLQPERPAACLATWEHMIPKTGLAAGKAAAALIAAAAGPQGHAEDDLSFDLVSKLVSDVSSAVGNGVIEVLLEAAHRRGMPWQMVDPVWPMIAFGQGSAMKRLMSTITETQGHISTLFTQDKMLSLQVLREAGFPVPHHHRVRSEGQAVAAATSLGFPVVVKPADLMRSEGVRVNLHDAQAVRRAFREARALSPVILVEDHLPGLPYRILVIDGVACAAMRRSIPMVVGDGRSSLRELIESTNRERAVLALQTATGPRRINIDKFREELEICLAEQNLDLESVPASGQSIQLAFKAQTGRGGENLDVTAEIHADTLAMAEDVARFLEVEVLGLDFMTADISRSFKEGNCGINEVNAEPALSLHQRVTMTPRDVATPFLDSQFSSGSDGCIPIVCSLAGPQAGAAPFTILQKALEFLDRQVGRAAGDDFAAIGRFRLPATTANPRPAGRLLADCRCDCALVELAPADFAAGLAFDRCAAAIVPRRLKSLAPAGGFDLDQARLLAEAIADTLILPLADYAFWSDKIRAAPRRIILLSQDDATAAIETALSESAEVLQLRRGRNLDLLHYHEEHCERLLALEAEAGKPSSSDNEAVLLAAAGLLALDYHPRDVTAALTAVWQSGNAVNAQQSRGSSGR